MNFASILFKVPLNSASISVGIIVTDARGKQAFSVFLPS